MKKRLDRVEQSITRYLSELDEADRAEPAVAEAKTVRSQEKLEALKEEMARLKVLDKRMQNEPDKQLSLTDPDSRSMATSGKGSGMEGDNVQAAVEPKNHLIVAHEVTNVGNDRAQLAPMAEQARGAMETGWRTAT